MFTKSKILGTVVEAPKEPAFLFRGLKCLCRHYWSPNTRLNAVEQPYAWFRLTRLRRVHLWQHARGRARGRAVERLRPIVFKKHIRRSLRNHALHRQCIYRRAALCVSLLDLSPIAVSRVSFSSAIIKLGASSPCSMACSMPAHSLETCLCFSLSLFSRAW